VEKTQDTISHMGNGTAGSMNSQTLQGGKGPQARRSGSSAGHHSSPGLPRQPWTDSRCGDKDIERADAVWHLSVGQACTAASALVKKIHSCNHVYSVSSRTVTVFEKGI
jgi:hypothetical protein